MSRMGCLFLDRLLQKGLYTEKKANDFYVFTTVQVLCPSSTHLPCCKMRCRNLWRGFGVYMHSIIPVSRVLLQLLYWAKVWRLVYFTHVFVVPLYISYIPNEVLFAVCTSFLYCTSPLCIFSCLQYDRRHCLYYTFTHVIYSVMSYSSPIDLVMLCFVYSTIGNSTICATRLYLRECFLFLLDMKAILLLRVIHPRLLIWRYIYPHTIITFRYATEWTQCVYK